MSPRLPQKYYDAPALDVARNLIGKVLVRRTEAGCLAGIIVETEAYCGPHDLASHASRGHTPRTAVMFGPPGHWYVYIIYGMYYCLNIVTEREGFPSAVLLRAVRGVEGLEPHVKTDGPGKLCRAFGIDKSYNTSAAYSDHSGLWIEDRGVVIDPGSILETPRINVDYAGEYVDKPWRFVVAPEPRVKGRRRPR